MNNFRIGGKKIFFQLDPSNGLFEQLFSGKSFLYLSSTKTIIQIQVSNQSGYQNVKCSLSKQAIWRAKPEVR